MPPTQENKFHAVLIGVNKHLSAAHPRLKRPVPFVRNVADYFTASSITVHHLANGTELANGVTLPTAGHFTAALKEAAAQIKDGGVLLLIFAGHCIESKQEKIPQLVFHDSDPESKTQYLTAQQIGRILAEEFQSNADDTNAVTAQTSSLHQEPSGAAPPISLLVVLNTCDPGGTRFINELGLLMEGKVEFFLALTSDDIGEPLAHSLFYRKKLKLFETVFVEELKKLPLPGEASDQWKQKVRDCFIYIRQYVYIQSKETRVPTLYGYEAKKLDAKPKGAPSISRIAAVAFAITTAVMGGFWFQKDRAYKELDERYKKSQKDYGSIKYIDSKEADAKLTEELQWMRSNKMDIIAGYPPTHKEMVANPAVWMHPTDKIKQGELAILFVRAINCLNTNSKMNQSEYDSDRYKEIEVESSDHQSVQHRQSVQKCIKALQQWGVLTFAKGQGFDADKIVTSGYYIHDWLGWLLKEDTEGVRATGNSDQVLQKEIDKLKELGSKQKGSFFDDAAIWSNKNQPLQRRDVVISLARAMRLKLQ